MTNRDTETVIVDRKSGTGSGVIIGLVVAVLLLIGAYFLFFNGSNGGGGTIDVDVPAVSVDVVPDGQ